MKKSKLTIALSAVVAVILSCAALISVSGSSKDDALITLGYLENVILPTFKEELLMEITFANAENIEGDDSEEAVEVSGTVSEEYIPISASYTLLELDKGQTIMADSICEFIARPGSKVEAISPFPEQGIADITNGREVLNGEIIELNAYCLIPRGSDGRGMKVLSEKAYIMIRGEYTIG